MASAAETYIISLLLNQPVPGWTFHGNMLRRLGSVTRCLLDASRHQHAASTLAPVRRPRYARVTECMRIEHFNRNRSVTYCGWEQTDGDVGATDENQKEAEARAANEAEAWAGTHKHRQLVCFLMAQKERLHLFFKTESANVGGG